MEDRYIAILIVAGMVIYFWVVSEIDLNKSSRESDEYANRKNKEALENKIKKLDRKLDRLQNKTNASKVKIKPKVQKPPSNTILRNRLVNSVRKQLKGFENND
jgi:flagellar basal body-associated protein FliL